MIKYPERAIEVIPECNDENDNPTSWAMISGRSYREGDAIGNPTKTHYIWIDKQDEQEYAVVNSDGNNLTGKVFKTLWGAKRSAEEIAYRQEDTGCYTD